MTYLADDLVTAVSVGASLPAANDLVTSANILSIADEETSDWITPWLRKHAPENYFVRYADQALVANQAEYRIPWRAQGASLRDLTFVDAAGNESDMNEIPLEERGTFMSGGSAWWSGLAYCIEGDRIILLPTPTSATGSIRVRYFRRPSRLVLAASAMLITGTNSTYPGAALASWSTSDRFDIVQANPNFDVLAGDLTASSVTAGVSVIFATNPSTETAINDYVALAGESPVIQLPVELHSTLEKLTRARVLEAIGDRRWEIAHQKALAALERKHAMFSPRNVGEHRKIINRSSPLRAGRFR